MSGRRRIIGVISTRTSDTEQSQLLRGIIPAAWEHNADVVVISNIYTPEFDDDEIAAENDIYRLIESPDLCGLILFKEAFINPTHRLMINDLMNSRSDIPQVAIGSELDGFDLKNCVTINTDDVTDIEDITEHLITVHGLTEIDVLTGYENYKVSHDRVDGYRRALEKHGIPFDESRVMYGNFWLQSGEELAKKYLSGERKMPQALLCTNDYMAYGFLDVFAENGVPVPETLTVVGYEFVRERHMHTPVLTTYQRNREQLGRIAAEMLIRKIETGEYGDFSPPSGRIVCGNSCSCGISLEDLNTELSTGREKAFYEFLHLYNQLEQRLTAAHSMDEFCQKFIGSEYLLRNSKGLDLCLYQNWIRKDEESDTMTCYPVYGGPEKAYNEMFNWLSLSVITSRVSHPAVYYCSPLFFSDRPFGFVMMRYDTPETYDPVFRSWMKAVSNSLEILRMKNDIQYLLECQNLSEYQDTLTGLLNRKGFSHEMHQQIRRQDDENCQAFCLLVQVGCFSDHLTLGNGSDEAEANRNIADMMRRIAGTSVICARPERDIYAFAGTGDGSGIIPLLKERMTAMLLNDPGCFSLYGVDSFCMASVQMEYESSTLLMKKAMEALASERQRLQEEHQNEHFAKLIGVRNQLYDPEGEVPTAEQLCKQLLVSAGHFRKIYKSAFGTAYHQDEMRMRMLRAVWLLVTTTLDISAVAQRCGYEDYGYFLRMFRQFTGYTPNQYRKL